MTWVEAMHTTMPPLSTLKKSRRGISKLCWRGDTACCRSSGSAVRMSVLLSCGNLADRLHHARVRSAPADVAIHVRVDLFVGRVRHVLKQCHCGHNHPGRAVAALKRCFAQEGLR